MRLEFFTAEELLQRRTKEQREGGRGMKVQARVERLKSFRRGGHEGTRGWGMKVNAGMIDAASLEPGSPR